jgi:hypothetical protein
VPVKIKSMGNGKYMTMTPGGVKGKNMTWENAKKQEAIINAADAGHPFTGKKHGGYGVGKGKKHG